MPSVLRNDVLTEKQANHRATGKLGRAIEARHSTTAPEDFEGVAYKAAARKAAGLGEAATAGTTAISGVSPDRLFEVFLLRFGLRRGCRQKRR